MDAWGQRQGNFFFFNECDHLKNINTMICSELERHLIQSQEHIKKKKKEINDGVKVVGL